MSLILSGSDGVSDIDGSASTPAIRGTDANTGIFFPAADTIAFAEGGAEAMRIDSSGRVGIGTTSPATLLNVSSATTNVARLRVTGTGSTSGNYRGYEFGSSGGFSGGIFQDEGTSALSFWSSSGGSSMVVDSSGNVGIGVTPSAWSLGKAIEVGFTGKGIWANNQNEVIYPNNAYFNSGWKYSVSSYAPSQYAQRDGLHAWYNAPSGTAGNTITFTQAMTLDASGNLGVGTTSPATKFNVSDSSTNCTITVTNSASNFQIQSNSNDGYFNLNGSGNIIFRSGTPSVTERARIDSSGRFTLSANAAGMEINSGTYQVKSQGSGQAYMGFVTATTALQCSFNSTSAGVSLGSAATSWGTFSDERMKDIIEPITDAANKVASLRAVIGKYKTDDEGVRRSFLIAQDVQAVLPEAVDSNISENLVLRYTEVIPLLVASIQELKAELDTANTRLAALENK